MTAHRTARRGLSLIEVLTVMAILGLLAAIAVGAFYRVIPGQKAGATEATLSALAAAIEQKRTAIVDGINGSKRDAPPPEVRAFAGNDDDRARVVWTYLRLAQEFPTSFAEASTSYTVTSAAITAQSFPAQVPVVAPVTTLSRRDTFVKWLPKDSSGNNYILPTPNPSPELQSAVCLYLALTQTGSGGVALQSDGLQHQSIEVDVGGGQTMRVFRDSWGNPITFVRLGYAPELNNAKYTNTRAASPDPIDPLKKLPGWSNLSTFWTTVVQNHLKYNGSNPPTSYPTQGWAMTAVSAGPNGKFGKLFGDTADDDSLDNIVSFRLRAGNRGD